MATSGTFSWNLNTAQIINGALRILSAIQSGETPPADEYEDALAALNGLTKFWQASGIHVWSEIDCMLFLQPSQPRYEIGTSVYGAHSCPTIGFAQTELTADAAASDTSIVVGSSFNFGVGYPVGIWLDAGTTFWSTVASVTGTTIFLTSALPSAAASGAIVVNYQTDLIRPLKVLAARRYQFAASDATPIEIPMAIMSRIDYANLPNKTVPGTPTQFFYDPSLTDGLQSLAVGAPGIGQFFVWPAPANNLSAVRFTAQRPLQDFVTQANTADLPQEWISALRYNLAVELAAEYDCPAQRFAMIKALADEKLEMCRAWDRETEPVLFGISMDPASRT